MSPVPGICTTSACVRAAAGISAGLHPNWPSIDPCSDFSQFVCRGFNRQNPVPAGSQMTGTMLKMTSDAVFLDILETDPEGWLTVKLTGPEKDADRKSLQKMKKSYDVCMDTRRIQKVGLGELRPIIKTLVDTFSATFPSRTSEPDEMTVTDVNSMAAMGETNLFLDQLGVNGFFSLVINPDWLNSSRNVLHIYPEGNSGLGHMDHEMSPLVVPIIAEVLTELHPRNLTKEDALYIATELRILDRKLRAVYIHRPQDESPKMDRFSYDELLAKIPVLKALDATYVIEKSVPNAGALRGSEVIVLDAYFFRQLKAILESMPREVIQAYFIMRIVLAMKPYVISDLTKRMERLYKSMVLDDPDAHPTRRTICLNHVSNGATWHKHMPPAGFGWQMGRFYIERAFSPATRDAVLEIVDEIREQFLIRLADQSWMSEGTREAAKEKATALIAQVGWPESSPDVTSPLDLQKYYADLPVTDSYLQNAIAAAKHARRRQWRLLGQPVDRDAWVGLPNWSNAFYQIAHNKIVILAGAAQPPLFDLEYPAWMNYAAIGSIAGHELTHGFDPSGRRLAANGSAADWWDDATEAEFERRAQCFVHQYGNMTVTENVTRGGLLSASSGRQTLRVDGQRTLAENMADAGGLNLAHAAWKTLRRRVIAASGQGRGLKGPRGRLPGLESFTDEQLFFIHGLQTWCGQLSPDMIEWNLKNDVHTPPAQRINGMAANSRAFREAFHCPIKEPTCELW